MNMRLSMELSDLTVFNEVASTGSITAAAQRLNRVPSNVTARIQKLEKKLGLSLFVREKNRLRISPAGEQLLPYAQQMLALSQEAINALQGSHPKGSLKIGAMEAVAASYLTGTLTHFHRQYPAVDLQLKTGPTGRLIEEVLAGQLDMARVADPLKDTRLHIQPAFQEELVVISDLGHSPITTPKDLGTEPTLLGFNHRCAYRTRLCEWTKQADVVANVVEISSYHALLSCAAAGMGVGMVPKSLLAQYPFTDSIQIHALPQHWHNSTTAIIWRKDSLKPSMTAFAEQLLSNETTT